MFTETLDVLLKGRHFTIEATATVKYDDDGVTILDDYFTCRIFEDDVLINGDDLYRCDDPVRSIDWGFDYVRDLVKR